MDATKNKQTKLPRRIVKASRKLAALVVRFACAVNSMPSFAGTDKIPAKNDSSISTSAGIVNNSSDPDAMVAIKKLKIPKIPRVSKPWKDAFRLVGDGNPLYSDFSLIKDKLGQWHCIGTFGEAPHTIGSGHEPSDGYTLFHAVGNSLEAPMTHLAKIPYQIESKEAVMWAPGTIWNKDMSRAYLYYFHFFIAIEEKPNSACRLLISDSPDLSAWRPYDGTELSETNMVFREHLDRDYRVFWDDRVGKYLMYYCGLPGGPRVRTSTDLLHWSESVEVLKAPLDDPHGYAESPFVLYRDGYYYLWVSGIDYSHTHLYISEDPFNFGDAIANSIEEQPGHAPEIISENGVDYMACSMVSTKPSTFPADYDLDGILIQPLRWDKPDYGMEARITRKP